MDVILSPPSVDEESGLLWLIGVNTKLFGITPVHRLPVNLS
jgi:hypothetical protein